MRDRACSAAARHPGIATAADTMPTGQFNSGGKEKKSAGAWRCVRQGALTVEAKVISVKQRWKGGGELGRKSCSQRLQQREQLAKSVWCG
jgi:hypothetical protein